MKHSKPIDPAILGGVTMQNLWDFFQFGGSSSTQILAKLDQIINLLQGMKTTMTMLDDDVAQLQADVAADTVAVSSAVTLINGIAGQIQTAVDAALAAGATPAQLQSLTDLHTAVAANTQSLAAAVAANTPAPAP